MVITVSTRNRVTGKTVRGFESHRLRQKQENQALGLVFLFFTKVYDDEPLRFRALRETEQVCAEHIWGIDRFGRKQGFRIPPPPPTKNALLSTDKGAFFE